MSRTMTYYKLRDKETGKFSCGGSPGHVRWVTSGGKVWKRRGDLTLHLSQHTTKRTYWPTYKTCRVPLPETWEIVVLTVEETDRLPARKWALRFDE